MKILHFIEGRCAPDTANGVDKVVYYLSEAEALLGNTVVVMCESDKAVLPVPGVEVINTPRTRNCLKLSRHAIKSLQDVKPDLIHLHSAYIPTGISIARWARREGIPYVISPHGNYSTSLAKRRRLMKWIYKRLFENACAAGASFVHSMGDESDIRDFGYQGRIVTVPNGFAMTSYLKQSGKQVLPPNIEGKKIILFLGRLDLEQKGLDILLEGFAALDLPNCHLIVVGPGWQDGDVRAKALARQLGLGPQEITFWGGAFGQEKADLLHVATCFIHPSRWEGFPMAVIEAMAFRKLCIVSEAADPQQILRENNLGVFCELSSQSVSDGIRRALSISEPERVEIGKTARELVKRDFSWRQVAGRMVEAYQETLRELS